MNNPTEIAKIIQHYVEKEGKKTTTSFRRGVVASTIGQYADVRMDGSAAITPRIFSLGSYTPKANDKVLVLSIGNSGTNLLILGKINTTDVQNSVDANGWRVSYLPSGKRQWRKRSSFGFTIGASNWSASLGSSNLPVGMANLNGNYLEGTAASLDSAVTVAIHSEPNSTSIRFMLSNQYGGSVTHTVHYSLCITEV